MTRFKFFLSGTSEAPILELPQSCLSDLHNAIDRCRYVEGRMVEINGQATSCGVLIPTGKIQMIAETD